MIFSLPRTYLRNISKEASAESSEKSSSFRSNSAVRVDVLRTARAGIRNPMTLMTRLCVRILTLTRRARLVGTEDDAGDVEDERSRSGDAWAESIVQKRRARGNKRLLEASRGEERRSRWGEEAVFEPRRWFTLQLTISLLKALADLLVLSLSSGGCPAGIGQCLARYSKRRRKTETRRGDEKKAPGSNPAPHYLIIYYASN